MIRGHPYKNLKWRHRRNRVMRLDPINEHLLAVGKSGVGKTVLDYDLFTQSVDAGESVVQIDTHGDLFRKCLRYCIHKILSPQAVVIIDPTHEPETYGAVQIALLEVMEGEIPYESVDGVVSSFKNIFGAGMMERAMDILRNAALTCQQAELSLGEIPLLLTDPAFRGAIIETIRDHDVRMFWNRFAPLKPTDFANMVEAVRNKCSAFFLNPYLKPVLSATHSSVDFFQALQNGAIILVNLSRDHLREESGGLFGALVMQKLHQAILQRQRLPEKERKPTVIYADESHEYYNADASLPLLEGAREWAGGVKMYCQSLSQFPADDVDVILGCVGTIVGFTVGRKDAERLAKEMRSFSGREVKEQSRNLWGRPPSPPTTAFRRRSSTPSHPLWAKTSASVSSMPNRNGKPRCPGLAPSPCPKTCPMRMRQRSAVKRPAIMPSP
jgi:hypothetical protein